MAKKTHKKAPKKRAASTKPTAKKASAKKPTAPKKAAGAKKKAKAKKKAGPKKAATPFSPESNPRGLRDIPFALPQVDPNVRRRARRLADALAEHYPDAHCELDYSAPHELLIATILSAQSTDAGVNKATPGLFRAFRSPAEFAAATPEQIEPYIKTIGLFRNKAKSIHAAMAAVVEDFGGVVPRTMDELLTLRGVARKTANVVLGNAFDTNDGFVVDTHIERLAKRLGLAPEDATVPMVERHLMALFPRERWSELGHMLIFHGRRACKARGGACEDHPICKRYGVACERRRD